MSVEINKLELLKAMFAMQDSFNKQVHPEWKTQNYAWHEAILVESAELIEHLGYKWWKHQEPNIDQVVMELVDIWHFAMSYMIGVSTDGVDYEEILDSLDGVENDFKTLSPAEIRSDICEIVNNITFQDPYERAFCNESFFAVWYGLGNNFADLYKMYIGKNALNIFRQNNGYKEGTYVKIWNDREDNEFLTDYLAVADINEKLMSNVLEYLQDIYSHRDEFVYPTIT
jgi:dimeric dUTPase (all-alpha-NTP-PPase superfamily)